MTAVDYAFWLGFGTGGMVGAIVMTIVVLIVVRRRRFHQGGEVRRFGGYR